MSYSFLEDNQTDFMYGSDYDNYDGFQSPFTRTVPRVAFIIAYSALCLLCLAGNSLVIYVIAREPRMRSTPNLFLSSLAVADLCVGIFCIMPNLGLFLSDGKWILGRILCKLTLYIQHVSTTASMTTLCAIAVERYLVISHPLHSRTWITRRIFPPAVISIWVFCFAYSTPILFMYDVYEAEDFSDYSLNKTTTVYYCIEQSHFAINKRVLITCNFVIMYLIPVVMLTSLYCVICRVLWTSQQLLVQLSRPVGGNIPNRSRSTSLCSTNTICSSSTRNTSLKNGSETHDVIHMDELAPLNSKTSVSKDSLHPPPADNVRNQRLNNNNTCAIENGKESRRASEYEGISIPVPRRKPATVLESRKKVIRLLIGVVLCFVLLCLPYHIQALLLAWDVDTSSIDSEGLAGPIVLLFIFLTSALNPFLYALLSQNFRHVMRSALLCKTQGDRNKINRPKINRL